MCIFSSVDDPPTPLLSDSNSEWENYWTVCYAVSFDRRCTLLASGNASALSPINNVLGLNMSALHWPPPPIVLGTGSFVYNCRINKT